MFKIATLAFGGRLRAAAALIGAGYAGYKYLMKDPVRRQQVMSKWNSLRGRADSLIHTLKGEKHERNGFVSKPQDTTPYSSFSTPRTTPTVY